MEAAELDQIPFFAELTADERRQVAECMHEVEVEAGKELAHQGDWAYQLFVIESGEAEVLKDGELVMTLGPGDVFGEIGLMATGRRRATVVAKTPMRLAVMFLQNFIRLEHNIPSLAHALRKTMAEHVGDGRL